MDLQSHTSVVRHATDYAMRPGKACIVINSVTAIGVIHMLKIRAGLIVEGVI